MKRLMGILFTVASLCGATAATNDLAGMLQKGLFEEEANHDLSAAVQAYQSVVLQMDKDRKLAATAVFRLGECYRKQGNTNDATAQYERVLRDFVDQPILVDLSRKNLAAMGKTPVEVGAAGLSSAARTQQLALLNEELQVLQKQLATRQAAFNSGVGTQDSLFATERDILRVKMQIAQLEAMAGSAAASGAASQAGAAAAVEAAELTAKLDALKKLPAEKLRPVLQQEYPNPVLASLLQKLVETEQSLKAKQLDYGPEHPEVKTLRAVCETVNQQIDEQTAAMLTALELRRDAASRAAKTGETRGAPVDATGDGRPLESDEVARIQSLIKNSPDLINAPGKEGLTLLQSAAAKGEPEVARLLLDNGAAVDGIQKPGLTPLHYAAANGHKSMVDLLLSKKASVDAGTMEAITPLHLAAAKGYETVAEALIKAGAPVNVASTAGASWTKPDLSASVGRGQTPLHVAAQNGYEQLVSLLIRNKADTSLLDSSGATALFAAARAGRSAIVKTLLDAGADPNAGTSLLPLHVAVDAGDLASVKLLLEKGADPNAERSGTGVNPPVSYTPLSRAVEKKLPAFVETLIRAKADPNGPAPVTGSAENRPPILIWALSDGATLKALLEGGADPNRQFWNGSSALVEAARQNLKDAVALLLKHGAKPDLGRKDGCAALHFAAIHCNGEIIENLLKAGADANLKAYRGLTALRLAVDHNDATAAELLLKYKADPNVQDNDGKTPLDLAKVRQGPTGAAMPSPIRLARPPGPPVPGARVASSAPGVATSSQPDQSANLPDLLRKYGAVDEMPMLDQIRLKRGQNYVYIPFRKPASPDYGGFTLLEALAVQYDFLAQEPSGESSTTVHMYPGVLHDFFSHFLTYPDLAHLTVRRPSQGGTNWSELRADFTDLLEQEKGDCSKDIKLEWGDVVEIPEQDHPINEAWPAFSKRELANIQRCLSRTVEVVIKGQKKQVYLAPDLEFNPAQISIRTKTPFWIKPALLRSRMILASSDLTQVKVTRAGSANWPAGEWVLDCSGNKAPAFWLRDGDVIEIPDKP